MIVFIPTTDDSGSEEGSSGSLPVDIATRKRSRPLSDPEYAGPRAVKRGAPISRKPSARISTKKTTSIDDMEAVKIKDLYIPDVTDQAETGDSVEVRFSLKSPDLTKSFSGIGLETVRCFMFVPFVRLNLMFLSTVQL